MLIAHLENAPPASGPAPGPRSPADLPGLARALGALLPAWLTAMGAAATASRALGAPGRVGVALGAQAALVARCRLQGFVSSLRWPALRLAINNLVVVLRF
jgi:hypothetical protein